MSMIYAIFHICHRSHNQCKLTHPVNATFQQTAKNLLSSQAPARCNHTGTKFNMLHRLYIKVSQNEIRRTNIFQKQNNYNKIFFTSRICKSAAMGRSRRLVSLNEVRPPVIMCGGGTGYTIITDLLIEANTNNQTFPSALFPHR